MGLFFKILYSKWGELKTWIRLNFLYPYKENHSGIKSIVPAALKIKEGTTIGKDVIILSHLKEIGKNVYIGGNTYIGLCRSIGSFTSISFGVKIGLRNHPLDLVSTSPIMYGTRRGWVKENKFSDVTKSMVEIGSDVLISANVVILEGVKIGDGAVIAAGAVVSGDVEPYAIVGGVPAKLIRYRFEEPLRSQLLNSRWWELSDDQLKNLSAEAGDPLKFLATLPHSSE
jgi:acetyltransferase-like isoleucine patch superfamily enzyme